MTGIARRFTRQIIKKKGLLTRKKIQTLSQTRFKKKNNFSVTFKLIRNEYSKTLNKSRKYPRERKKYLDNKNCFSSMRKYSDTQIFRYCEIEIRY